MVSSRNSPEVRLLSSTGVTRRHQYYKPVRHPKRPGLLLTEFQLRVTSLTDGASRVSTTSVCIHADANTPAESLGAYRFFPNDGGLPRYYGGSAPTLAISRPARCSHALRSARHADPQKGPFLEVLQAIRHLLTHPECFRLERELAGPDSNREKQCTLATRGTSGPRVDLKA